MYPAAIPHGTARSTGSASHPAPAVPGTWRLSSVMPPLGALPTAAAAARAHVRIVLKSWGLAGDLPDDIVTVVSELIANAVNASTGPDDRPLYVNGRMPVVWLRLCIDETTIRAEVWDEAPGMPARQAVGEDAESGRGLDLVVGVLSADWGWFPAQSGKCTWAEFRP